MKLNSSVNRFMNAGRWMVRALLGLMAIALLWQSPVLPTGSALAADLGDSIKNAAESVRQGSKELIRNTQDTVEDAANSNAGKVDRTDENGGIFERKATRDRNRIEKRASEDARRTERAVDKNMNAVKKAVDDVKGGLN